MIYAINDTYRIYANENDLWERRILRDDVWSDRYDCYVIPVTGYLHNKVLGDACLCYTRNVSSGSCAHVENICTNVGFDNDWSDALVNLAISGQLNDWCEQMVATRMQPGRPPIQARLRSVAATGYVDFPEEAIVTTEWDIL